MPKFVLGLVGQAGSGKGAVAQILQHKYGAQLYRYSIVLNDILERLALEQSRDHQIKLSEALRSSFGEAVFGQALIRDLSVSQDPLTVVDGFRQIATLELFARLAKFKLIAITASPELRYARIKQRGEKIGERDLTWEQFLQQEQASTEKVIPDVMRQAWRTIDNNGTLDSLETQLTQLMTELSI